VKVLGMADLEHRCYHPNVTTQMLPPKCYHPNVTTQVSGACMHDGSRSCTVDTT